MFAELAAITSAISAINQTISTFKEGKANAQQAASLLGKFGTTAQKLDDWEKKKKLKRQPLPHPVRRGDHSGCAERREGAPNPLTLSPPA